MATTAAQSVTRFAMVLLGGVLGAGLGAGFAQLAKHSTPTVYSGRVLFVATSATPDVAADAAAWREEITRKLSDPAYLPQLISNGLLPIEAGTQLRDSLALVNATEGGALLALTAQGRDESLLRDALDTIAVTLIEEREKRRGRRLDSRLNELESLSGLLLQQEQRAGVLLEDRTLPTWAESATLTLGRLDGELFGLTLRRRLGDELSPQMREREKALVERIKAIQVSADGDPPVAVAQFEARRSLASMEWKRAHLVRARRAAEIALVAPAPIRVVQGARVDAIPSGPDRRPWYALVCACVGAILLGWRSPAKPEQEPNSDGPTLEANLNVRVIAVLPAEIDQFAVTRGAPLASLEPDHIALGSIQSLGTALALLANRDDRHGPLIMVDIDDAGHAGHALVNLAIKLADRGRRVLVVEAGVEGGVLDELLVAGTHVDRSDVPTADTETGPARGGARPGRIRFVLADAEAGEQPPVPGAFINYFDSILMRTDDIARASSMARHYDGVQCVFVGSHTLPLRTWRAARRALEAAGAESSLVGLVQGGLALDDTRYADPV